MEEVMGGARVVRVGLIGVGGMGGMHSECYRMLEDQGRVRVVAVADPDEERLLKALRRHGPDRAGYKTGLGLIERAEVDLVDVCTPTDLHAVHALAAMERARAVVSEKPLCLTEADLDALLAKRRETGAALGVAQCLRFWDEYEWLKAAVDAGTYGATLAVTMTRLGSRPWAAWYSDPARSGSAALDLHIHDVDMLYHLYGRPRAITPRVIRDKRGMIERIITVFDYGGHEAVAEAAWSRGRRYPFAMTYRVIFERGEAVYDSSRKPGLVVYPAEGEPFSPAFDGVTAESAQGINISALGAYYKELAYFTDRVARGEQFGRSGLEDVAASLRLAFEEMELAGGACSTASGGR